MDIISEAALPPGLGLWGIKGDAEFGPLCGGQDGLHVQTVRDEADVNNGDLDKMWVARC